MILTIIFLTYFLLGLQLFFRLKKSAPYHNEINTKLVNVGIVIPFRNEKENLPTLLNCINNLQTNKIVEWIFVNDHSTDNGTELISVKKNVRLINLEQNKQGKKQAVLAGINSTECDIYVCIDADVTFNSGWLDNLLKPIIIDKVEWVIGPVKMQHAGDSILAKIQELEWKALQRLTEYCATFYQPVLCNGANLAFSNKLKKYAVEALHRQSTVSGDDLSLMNAFNANNFKVCYGNEQAAVSTNLSKNWVQFVNQKLRWAKKMNGQWNSTTQIGLVMTGMQLILICSWFFCEVEQAVIFTIIKFVADSLLIKQLQVLNFPYWVLLQIYPLILWIIHPFVRIQWKDRFIKA